MAGARSKGIEVVIERPIESSFSGDFKCPHIHSSGS